MTLPQTSSRSPAPRSCRGSRDGCRRRPWPRPRIPCRSRPSPSARVDLPEPLTPTTPILASRIERQPGCSRRNLLAAGIRPWSGLLHLESILLSHGGVGPLRIRDRGVGRSICLRGGIPQCSRRAAPRQPVIRPSPSRQEADTELSARCRRPLLPQGPTASAAPLSAGVGIISMKRPSDAGRGLLRLACWPRRTWPWPPNPPPPRPRSARCGERHQRSRRRDRPGPRPEPARSRPSTPPRSKSLAAGSSPLRAIEKLPGVSFQSADAVRRLRVVDSRRHPRLRPEPPGLHPGAACRSAT